MNSRPAPNAQDDWTDAALLSALRQALRDEALAVHYQPQVALYDGQVTGFEALLRWTDSRRGPVAPSRFIPVAEADGLIGEVGEWVLRRACSDSAALRRHYGEGIRMAVNLSPAQVHRTNIADVVTRVLRETGLSPRALELEITEGVPLSIDPEVREQLEAIHALGVSLAIDDSGVGYANLSYVVDLPIDTLKIDGRFVAAPDENARAAAVLRALMLLAHDLDLNVIGECAETEAQLVRLVASAADTGSRWGMISGRDKCGVQGFYFSPPLDCETLCRRAAPLQAMCRERAIRAVE